jgi:hypothetical protein
MQTRRNMLIFSAAAVVPAFGQGEAAAQRDALAWLVLVDQKKYKESWQRASRIFQSGVTAAEWEAQVKRVRDMVGELDSRKFKSVKKTKSLPGAPDGDYEVLEFDASFTQKATAVETVVMSQEGSWKVAGYFIR